MYPLFFFIFGFDKNNDVIIYKVFDKMGKKHLNITIDEIIWRKIRLDPKFDQKLSNLIENFLKGLIESQESNPKEKGLQRELDEVKKKINELETRKGIIQTRLFEFEQKRSEEKTKSLKRGEKMLDTAKLHSLAEKLLR